MPTVLAALQPATPEATATPPPTPAPLALPTADALAATLPTLFQALVAIALTLATLRLAQGWSVRAMRRGRVDVGTSILVGRLLTVTWLVVGSVVVLSILGVNPATLVTVLGAIGLAASLALQDILKNFFAGLYLLLERPFRVGEVIRVKEQQGTVEHVGIRTTTLRTPENVEVLVPNAMVFAEVVTNHTHAVVTPQPPGAPAASPPAATSTAPAPATTTAGAAAAASGQAPGVR
jgi:small-conductance mechanosensitive channel